MSESSPIPTELTVFGMVVQPPYPGGRGVNSFWTRFVLGLEEGLDQRGAQVILRTATDVEDELDVLRQWAEREQVAAVVLGDLGIGDPRPALCAELRLPAVVLAGDPLDGQVVVEVHHRETMQLAVDFLTALGHTRIGRVTGPPSMHTALRDEEFSARIAHHGVEAATRVGDYSAVSGADLTRDLLTLATPPTAIVYDNDVMAVAGLGVATEMGVSVPGHLSILAWDDSPDARLAQPPLSVVRHDVHALGVLTSRALIDLVGGATALKYEAPAPDIVERESTAAETSSRSSIDGLP